MQKQIKKIKYVIEGTLTITDKDIIFHIPEFKDKQKIKIALEEDEKTNK